MTGLRGANCYKYCLEFLNLSENNTYSFLAIARKSRFVPELKQAIKDDLITVSKAKRILPVINETNKNHWLDLAKTLSKSKLEKEVAKLKPEVLTPERTKYVSENRLKLEMGISEDVMQELKRVQEILSQKKRSHVSYEQILEFLLKDFSEKGGPASKGSEGAGSTGFKDSRGSGSAIFKNSKGSGSART